MDYSKGGLFFLPQTLEKELRTQELMLNSVLGLLHSLSFQKS